MIFDKRMVLGILLKQEWKKNKRSLRFRLSWILMLCVFICGTTAFVRQWKNTEAEYEQYQKAHHDDYYGWTVTTYATITQEYLLQSRLSSLIDPCWEQQLPSMFTYNAFGIHHFNTAFSVKNPLMEPDISFSWSFVVTTLLSFITLLLSFNAFSGEKETHTLGFLLTYPVSRFSFLLSRYLCVLLQVSILLLSGMGAGILILLLAGIEINAHFIILCGGFFLSALLLFSLFAAFGLFASTITGHSRNSLLLCIVFWLLSVIILPNSRLSLARYLYPMPVTFEEVQQEYQEQQHQIIKNAPASALGNKENEPFYPPHEMRADIMRRMLEVKLNMLNEYYRYGQQQYERTNRLLMGSPVITFHHLNEYWLDSGYARFRKNEKALADFCIHFMEWFKAEDAKDPESPHWLNPQERYSSTQRPLTETEYPVYKEPEVTLSHRLLSSLPYVFILLGITLLWFILSIFAFNKYDVR